MKFKCTIVITYNYNSDNNHYGIVNNLGDMVVSPIYEELYWIDEENGILAAKLNGKWGVIDYKGKEIVAHEYKEMNGYNGFVIAEDKNRRSIMMNANGNVIIPLGKYALSCYNGWVVWAEDEDKYALINTKGEIVLPFKNYGKMEPIYGRTYKYFHDNVMCKIGRAHV